MVSSKTKKVLITALSATAGFAALGTGLGLGLTNKNHSVIQEDKSNIGFGAITDKEMKSAYKTNLRSLSTNVNEEKKYVMSITENTREEGVIYFVTNDNDFSQEIEFKPGDTIKIKIVLAEDKENYTAREIKVFGKNKNIFIPSKQDAEDKQLFLIKMPSYEETLDKETKESWLYSDNTIISVVPTFIKASIGNGDNKVDWEHGAFADSLNGYVYEVKSDMTWSTIKNQIYTAFENKEIDNPIDVYFYLNGHTITFDVNTINLDVKSGWALHFKNNKYDNATSEGKYGEIKVAGEREYSELSIEGSVSLGRSIKFKMYHGVNSLRFVNFDSKLNADFLENDPSKK